jgi:hypothetical protein
MDEFPEPHMPPREYPLQHGDSTRQRITTARLLLLRWIGVLVAVGCLLAFGQTFVLWLLS